MLFQKKHTHIIISYQQFFLEIQYKHRYSYMYEHSLL
jgi:hypothetical protein